MTRLIDADALLESLLKTERLEPIEGFNGWDNHPDAEGSLVWFDSIFHLITNSPTVQRELVIDCKTCANRGVVNGSSQETFCEHCIHSTSWKRNYYKPLSAAPKE